MIKSLRLGFATNSSSTHSIIISPESKYFKNRIYDSYGFGWEDFSIKDYAIKIRYLSYIFKDDLKKENTERARELLSFADNVEYIDHQSIIVPPHGEYVLSEFIDSLSINDDVIIFGGNDNSVGWSTKSAAAIIGINLDSNIIVHDDEFDFVIFNVDNGFKCRIGKYGNSDQKQKSSFPELVDIKITDYCDKDCSFCYQNSTTAGKHANLNNIKRIASYLSKAGTFEVALGGGEPTSHPHIIEILDEFNNLNIRPNITSSYDLDFFKSDVFKDIINRCGAMGVSVTSSTQIEKIQDVIDDYYVSKKIVFQTVLGVVTPIQISQMMSIMGRINRLLVLGYKNVGRGIEFSELRYDNADVHKMLENAKKWAREGNYFSVDTAFVDKHKKELDMANIPEILRSSPEGKFSCYIDLVTKRMSPSSYCLNSQYEAFPNNYDEFIENFRRY